MPRFWTGVLARYREEWGFQKTVMALVSFCCCNKVFEALYFERKIHTYLSVLNVQIEGSHPVGPPVEAFSAVSQHSWEHLGMGLCKRGHMVGEGGREWKVLASLFCISTLLRTLTHWESSIPSFWGQRTHRLHHLPLGPPLIVTRGTKLQPTNHWVTYPNRIQLLAILFIVLPNVTSSRDGSKWDCWLGRFGHRKKL